ncbi:histidine phosphatase family protein [Epidermidibacterium keratini]|uniref:Histidine phosphatase family protein n=1 Tax=Epidermidibacterium keratini TaxID=1891644 RepID=A0A7L4YRC4_9ACTN|nr:histidine phosphatase family protein [Epidermidibacterium keratini]QHC01670.1 histidine phosphatase family protein [Epidermidibacterium keratini]
MSNAADTPDFGSLLVARHGQTEWSRSGQHTSFTDLPLLPEGEAQARGLAPLLAQFSPTRALSSPLERARRTAELAGFADPEIVPELTEWNYGDYEGRTRSEIQQDRPGWSIWTGTPEGGELITDVAARAGHVIATVLPDLEAGNNVVVFSHGHFSRVLVATWLGLAPADGRMFILDAGSFGVLGEDRDQRVVRRWNQPS